MSKLRKFTKGVSEESVNKSDISSNILSSIESLSNELYDLKQSTNTLSKSGDAETHLGKEGDIKINKIARNKYEFYVRGEDGWHKDNNASFGPIDESKAVNDPPIVNMTSGTFNYSYEGNNRLSINLDSSNSSSTYTPTPEIKSTGNLKLSTGSGKTITLANNLSLSSIPAGVSDYDKILVSDGGAVKYRTGAQLLSDIGADSHTAASTTASGVVELATSAETNTGTDTSRAVTPDGLDAWEGSGQIETVGEITTGTWNADTLGTGAIPNLPTSKITSGTFDDARIAASNVTQHEGSIDAVGTLDGGAISSGFGNIDNGSSTITTTGAISGGSFNHFMDVKIHQFYASATTDVYMPFGASQIEAAFTSDGLNDDTLFIAPYNGYLEKVVFQNANTAGDMGTDIRMYLRVAGSLGTVKVADVTNETTATWTFGSDESFTAGQRLRIYIRPNSVAPKYVTATSVWRYTI